jgi:hypothetical protein
LIEKEGTFMKNEKLYDVEKLYDQVQVFLAGEGPGPESLTDPSRGACRDSAPIVPEKYLLKDNLLLLLKES